MEVEQAMVNALNAFTRLCDVLATAATRWVELHPPVPPIPTPTDPPIPG